MQMQFKVVWCVMLCGVVSELFMSELTTPTEILHRLFDLVDVGISWSCNKHQNMYP